MFLPAGESNIDIAAIALLGLCLAVIILAWLDDKPLDPNADEINGNDL